MRWKSMNDCMDGWVVGVAMAKKQERKIVRAQ